MRIYLNIIPPHLKSTDEKANIIPTNCISINDYIRKNILPTLIKIDVEGAEMKVLSGCTSLLQINTPPTFLVTAHSDNLLLQVTSLFKKYGFTILSDGNLVIASK